MLLLRMCGGSFAHTETNLPHPLALLVLPFLLSTAATPVPVLMMRHYDHDKPKLPHLSSHSSTILALPPYRFP